MQVPVLAKVFCYDLHEGTFIILLFFISAKGDVSRLLNIVQERNVPFLRRSSLAYYSFMNLSSFSTNSKNGKSRMPSTLEPILHTLSKSLALLMNSM